MRVFSGDSRRLCGSLCVPVCACCPIWTCGCVCTLEVAARNESLRRQLWRHATLGALGSHSFCICAVRQPPAHTHMLDTAYLGNWSFRQSGRRTANLITRHRGAKFRHIRTRSQGGYLCKLIHMLGSARACAAMLRKRSVHAWSDLQSGWTGGGNWMCTSANVYVVLSLKRWCFCCFSSVCVFARKQS